MRPQRPFVQRKCGVKIGYETYAAAFVIAKSHWQYYKEKMLPYECPLCGKFHIGHQRKPEELSTAFVPLHQKKPKQEPKPKKVKQPPPVKKQKEVKAYYPPVDPFKRISEREANKAMNEEQRLRGIRKREENNRRIAAIPVKEGNFHWWVACDDGWNQHV